MKNRDVLLFGLPLTAALLIAAFAAFLYWQITAFENSYTAEVRENIAQEARLVAAIVDPMLQDGNLEEAVRFCGTFDRDTFRVTLIDSTGKVAADSGEKAGFLGNHLDREEVQKALTGTPASVSRYSESLNRWMMYYAVPLKTANGDFVLRAATSTDKVSRMLDFARLNMFWALLFGAEIVLILTFYIVRSVRKPLVALQKSVGEIAAGKLETRIEIPESGVVRELAAGVAGMTGQLKHRLAETARERNEKDTLLETMSEAVLLFADDGTLLRHNTAACRMFGFAPGDQFQLARCRIPELLPLAHKTLQTAAPFEREFTLQHSGGTRSLFIKGRPLSDESNKRLLLTATDLTSLHRLESFRSDFIANVSHEIKTPLTSIVGAVEALEEKEELSPELQSRLYDILKSQAKRLNNLIHDILGLAEIERRQLNSTRTFAPCQLDTVTESAVNLCSPSAAQAGIELTILENTPATIDADNHMLEQALVNLIDNAIKYSNSPRIEVSLKHTSTQAVYEVRDYGTGIPPEHTGRIFERFYRADKSRSRELGGTGLGLAIVKHIAQLHHGSAELESPLEEGCIFRITLPLHSPSAAENTSLAVGARESASPLP